VKLKRAAAASPIGSGRCPLHGSDLGSDKFGRPCPRPPAPALGLALGRLCVCVPATSGKGKAAAIGPQCVSVRVC